MDVRIANAQMVKFLGTALANDLADAVAIRREAGRIGRFWSASRSRMAPLGPRLAARFL